jgi:predicted lactoylglutathione lyase
MARKTFVHLPVKDLHRSVAFFGALGFEFSPEFTDEQATAMVVSDEAFVMLLVEDFFTTFTGKPVPDTSSSSEVVVALSADSRAEVDTLVERALAAGGARSQDKVVDGPMYGWSFVDPDGHHWELIHMELGQRVA